MDRIDIFLPVAEIDYKKLSDKIPEGTDTSKNIRDRVLKAREIQTARFADPPSLSGATARRRKINTNSEMSAKDLEKFAPLGEKPTFACGLWRGEGKTSSILRRPEWDYHLERITEL